MKKNIIVIIILILSCLILKGQKVGTFAELKLNNITRISPDSISFEITLKRLTDDWHYFANSTFQLGFDTAQFKFDKNNLTIRRDSTGLTLGVLTGNSNPAGGYVLTEQIMRNKFAIGILCPETIEESQQMPLNTEFVLGKYTIFTNDKRYLPPDLKWLGPVNYYQKSAFKLEQDSLVGAIKLFHKNDNLEMITRKRSKIAFSENILPYLDTLVLVDFDVRYVGQRKMDITWATREEMNVFGFMIKKSLRMSPLDNPDLLTYELIYTCHSDSVKQFRPEMLSKGNTMTGFKYGALPDTVELRGVEYCYQLYCCRYDSTKVNMKHDIFLAQTCEPVPNSLIISAQIITENPFNDNITIEFQLADDCLLSIGAYDLNGKLVEMLTDKDSGEKYDKRKINLGTYKVTFDPVPMVSSGSYYVNLIAFPINDNTMESSQVVLKILNLK